MSANLDGFRYDGIAQGAHWLIAGMLIGSFTLGFTMTELPTSPLRLRLFAWHKWLGVLVFSAAVLRLAWRLGHPPPQLPGALPAWQREAARISHRFLYVFLIAVPLSGWLMSSAKGFQTVLFGSIPIPDLLGKNPPLGAALEEVHHWLAWLFIALITVHVTAALKHLLDRDGVFLRMLPFRERR